MKRSRSYTTDPLTIDGTGNESNDNAEVEGGRLVLRPKLILAVFGGWLKKNATGFARMSIYVQSMSTRKFGAM